MSLPFDLDRFVAAQNPVIDQVRRELRAGVKRGHWMWFVFPRIAAPVVGSALARYFAGAPDRATLDSLAGRAETG